MRDLIVEWTLDEGSEKTRLVDICWRAVKDVEGMDAKVAALRNELPDSVVAVLADRMRFILERDAGEEVTGYAFELADKPPDVPIEQWMVPVEFVIRLSEREVF